MNYTFVDFISSDNSLNLNWHHIVQAKWINRWLDSFRNDWVVIKFPLVAEQDSKYRKKGEVLWNVYENVDQIKANSGNLFNTLYQQNPIKQLNEY